MHFVALHFIAPEIIAMSRRAWFNLAVYYVATWPIQGHKCPICGAVKSPRLLNGWSSFGKWLVSCYRGDTAESSCAINLDKWEWGDPPRCRFDFLFKISRKIFIHPIIYRTLITDTGLRIYFPCAISTQSPLDPRAATLLTPLEILERQPTYWKEICW